MRYSTNTADELPYLARDKWRVILPALGIASEFLKNRHGPCPGCGGRDRYRWDDKAGRGTFVCGGGGDTLTGDGFDLLAHVFGWSKPETFRAVAEILGVAGDAQPPARKPLASHRPPPAPAPQRDTGAYARALWGRVNREGAIVAAHPYAIAKRLGGAFGAGRTRASGRLIGQGADCIIVPVRNPDGVLVAVECLSENRDANGKFLRQSFGPKSGGWLVLGNDLDPNLPRYVVEGWATGAKMLEHMGGNCAVYVAFGAGRLRAVAEEVEHRWPGSEVIVCREAAHA
ncbi:MAG: P4 alpha zinc-binding domain protein [Chromatiaceae bacterium]|nr:P4 alpha zinc-binding domain protein [Chromatiaceae bacterium]